ncbi:flagellar assembly protein FliT [Lysinibacillus sp. FJAT-14745]|uniref:flagellar protein FliT n=1 Tax=Lysinibacillus sp. FJAT-14745 TaxID=1704289 RepID=UPI0006AB9D85|nr:flagellar protein FliT [Lysinibacillus sp. FJAT-14745]KOP77732.1 flagellar assembly protein FliT [Lysinibacillus sp. FJAT-14745]
MDTILNIYLQTSAQLFKYLTNIPNGEERTQYISKINEYLDERGKLVDQIKQLNFQYDEKNKTHQTLFELDQGIQERLSMVMEAVKEDIKDLQNTKKHELQYIDPYESLRIVEGRYYDGKK